MRLAARLAVEPVAVPVVVLDVLAAVFSNLEKLLRCTDVIF